VLKPGADGSLAFDEARLVEGTLLSGSKLPIGKYVIRETTVTDGWGTDETYSGDGRTVWLLLDADGTKVEAYSDARARTSLTMTP